MSDQPKGGKDEKFPDSAHHARNAGLPPLQHQGTSSGKGRKVAANLLISLGAFCIFGAAGLSLHNYHVDRLGAEHCYDVVNQFQGLVTSREENLSYTQELPETSYDSVRNEGILINGDLYLGVLDIPSLGLTVPVHLDFSEQKLSTAPCAHFGNLAEDDLVIAGHNYRSHFGSLPRLSVGSKLSITDTNGKVYHYVVDVMTTLHESEVEAMKDREDWDLTLYTCDYPDGSLRIVVRCLRV